MVKAAKENPAPSLACQRTFFLTGPHMEML